MPASWSARGGRNEVLAAEWDEARSARQSLTELERVSGPRIVGGVYRVGEAEDEL